MFAPGARRYEEILDLANLATLDLLLDSQRPRWRELVTQLLGSVREASGGSIPERRQHLRAPVELEVDILAPEEMASLATSTIGSGGLSFRIAEEIPVGTVMELSITVAGRKVRLLVRAQRARITPVNLPPAFLQLFPTTHSLP